MEFRKRNLIMKYLEIFYIKYVMALKGNKEYKINLYSVLMFDVITLFVFYLFLSIFIGNLVGDILIGWRNYDYVLYYILLLHAGKGVRFFFLDAFSYKLLNGMMNIYLSKPTNPYFFSAIQTFRGANALTYPLLLIIVLIMVFSLDYTNYILGIITMFFGVIYYMVFFNFFASLSFFIKDNGKITQILSRDINFFIEDYTPKMFEKMRFSQLIYLFPCSVFGYLTIAVFKGNLVEFNQFILMIIITFFILFFGNMIIWKYGLKKYEAFG